MSNHVCQTLLVLQLRLTYGLIDRRIVNMLLQLLQLAEVGTPVRPMFLVQHSTTAGFASASQRRGVTPLVTLIKRIGKIFREVGKQRPPPSAGECSSNAAVHLMTNHHQPRHAMQHPAAVGLSIIDVT